MIQLDEGTILWFHSTGHPDALPEGVMLPAFHFVRHFINIRCP
jgi:hypothetical protein